jgi:3-hydroxymyristoyl/3-hydroxydecanoyl-(acyl carrier protein) dehydratase
MKRVLTIAPDHPAYDGHFPGHPLLPGVVLLAEALAAIESHAPAQGKAWVVENAKFLMPVLPGTKLTLSHDVLESGAVRFEIRSDAGVVASGVVAAQA